MKDRKRKTSHKDYSCHVIAHNKAHNPTLKEATTELSHPSIKQLAYECKTLREPHKQGVQHSIALCCM